jgi:L-rhamnose mutarotase
VTVTQPAKTNEEILAILSEVSFMDREFHLGEKNGVLFLQMRYMDKDVDTGQLEEQFCRKWQLSRYMTKSELVQTAFKAALTSQEHIAREFFRYKGAAVFGPHYDVDQLVELCQSKSHLDLRE